ncbi:cell wall hydrolase [Sandaracinobacter sp. RS1-74]|uniref:cell wall hydrolase n=1 Tax=Sandaracinobacteroides sayramensis TaxID=2913411 RepID=UPI001EDA3D41|nr:cell wall hydrolase [Sandaracinobacteroides sayramensis]MCG2841875.1 cell wall hydrolase [Sandaracinobacteroides sayramensis]
MRNPVRAAALLAAAVLLLAAGEAPNGDLQFLNEIESPGAEALPEPAPFVELAHDFPEPELGMILPEAGSLTNLVAGVREMEAGKMDSQSNCLATAVYFEAKGEPLDGQLAVAQVILNRVEDGRFGRDICAVVKAPRQFGFVKAGAPLPTPTNARAWEIARAVALIAISGSWQEIVPDATHFHATRVNPGWKLRRVATVGQHIFYR